MHPFSHVLWIKGRMVGQPARHKCTPRRDRPHVAATPKFRIGRGYAATAPAEPPQPSAPVVGAESTAVFLVNQGTKL